MEKSINGELVYVPQSVPLGQESSWRVLPSTESRGKDDKETYSSSSNHNLDDNNNNNNSNDNNNNNNNNTVVIVILGTSVYSQLQTAFE